MAIPLSNIKSNIINTGIPILNVLVLLGSLGLLVYSKYIFKRPPITETSERAKLELTQKKTYIDDTKTAFIKIEPLTINISNIPRPSASASPSPYQNSSRQTAKTSELLHYAYIGIAFEIRNESLRELFDAFQPYITDQLIVTIGRKTFDQLVTIQGRYILQSQIQDSVNQMMIAKAKDLKDPPVIHTYFTQLMIQ